MVTSSGQFLPDLADGFPLLPALLGRPEPPGSLLVHLGTRGLQCQPTLNGDTTEALQLCQSHVRTLKSFLQMNLCTYMPQICQQTLDEIYF